MNVPNYLTLLRICLIPIFVGIFYLPMPIGHWLSASVFALAAITDWLDGYLARSLKQTSALGAFLDPVADKLIVAVALILLVSQPTLPYLALPAAIIVSREIVISALREWMAELGKRASIAVSYIGKIKTAIQMLAIILLLGYHPSQTLFVGLLGYSLFYLAALLTLVTMILYLKTAWPDLKISAKNTI